MTENGAEHGRKVTRLSLDCGLVAHIEPLPYFVLKGIRQQANKLHPNPPEEDYRLPFPESAIPDDYKPATENPVYNRLVNEAATRRNDYVLWATARLCVNFEEDRGALITAYADRRTQFAAFVEMPEDDWEATLYCLVGNDDEMALIFRIASGQEPVTPDEVADGVRFFRRDLPGQAGQRPDRETSSIS